MDPNHLLHGHFYHVFDSDVLGRFEHYLGVSGEALGGRGHRSQLGGTVTRVQTLLLPSCISWWASHRLNQRGLRAVIQKYMY